MVWERNKLEFIFKKRSNVCCSREKNELGAKSERQWRGK